VVLGRGSEVGVAVVAEVDVGDKGVEDSWVVVVVGVNESGGMAEGTPVVVGEGEDTWTVEGNNREMAEDLGEIAVVVVDLARMGWEDTAACEGEEDKDLHLGHRGRIPYGCRPSWTTYGA
jgi:hypothetical protein